MVLLNSFCVNCWLIRVFCKNDCTLKEQHRKGPLPTQGLPDVEDNSVATYQLQTNVSKFKCSLLGLVLDTRRCAKWLRFLRKRTKWNDQCIARNNNFYSKTVLSSEHKTRGGFTFRSIAGQRGGRSGF